MLAAGALVASLFAVGASPAAAIDEDSEQGETAKFSACVGPALVDHGFTDLGTLEAAVPNINCLAYYGITKGKTVDTFDPNSNVTRSEMALFLYRAADKMGVDLMSGDMMADYGDIDGLGEDRQNAIRALARNGILMGRSDMAFEPGQDITRAEMAEALVALLDHTPGAPVHVGAEDTDHEGLYILGDTAGSAKLPDDQFSDAYALVSAPVNNAISAAYELGITTGKSLDVFGPHGTVPRRDMASFIVRAMAHSNLRPAGLTAQVDGTTIEVSVRDTEFKPVVNQAVDAFRATVANESKALKDDGTCSSRTAPFEGSPTKCEIDGADPVTQTDGDVDLTLAAGVAVGDGLTVWVWQGDLGDEFGADTDFVEVSIVPGAADPVAATSAAISTDLPKNPYSAAGDTVGRAHFGAAVTVTIQLTDSSTPAKNAVPPEAGPTKYMVKVATHNTPYREDGTLVGVLEANRLHERTESVTIGSDGKGSFTVTASDTNRNARGQVQSVLYTVTADDHSLAAAVSPGTVVFSDEAPVVTYVTVEGSGPQVAPGANGRAGNRVTIKVQDQFGDPVNGAQVHLYSSNPTGTNDPVGSTIRSAALNTRNGGSVNFGYSYSGGASRESLMAIWDGYVPAAGDDAAFGDEGTIDDPSECNPVGVGGSQSEDRCGTTTVDWVIPTELPARTASDGAVSILSIDVDDDQLVVDLQTNSEVTPTSINYDNNDFFTVTYGDASGPANIADFEAAVVADLKAAEATSAADQPTLTWGSYTYDDPTDIATFVVTAGGNRNTPT